ncbi:MAG: helix-turn-helix domain-containing protein [Lachnospiraceae bacterium]
MEWLENLQNAIEYMENHLLDDEALKTEEISKQAFSSEYNFRTIFRVITGYAVGEYIRNRRLALAGEELIHSKQSILEIACKYGYDTPESFTKAFQRFHGVSPSFVRKNHQGLKTFTRIVLKIQAVGGSVLDYCIEELDDIYLLGYENSFMEEEMEENHSLLPDFVQHCRENGLEKISSVALSGDFEEAVIGYRYHQEMRLKYVFGVSVDATYFDRSGDDSLANGVTEAMSECNNVGFPLVTRRIPAGKWIRFQCDSSGDMQELWHRIYTEFMPFSSYRFGDRETLEVRYKKSGEIKKVLYLPLL